MNLSAAVNQNRNVRAPVLMRFNHSSCNSTASDVGSFSSGLLGFLITQVCTTFTIDWAVNIKNQPAQLTSHTGVKLANQNKKKPNLETPGDQRRRSQHLTLCCHNWNDYNALSQALGHSCTINCGRQIHSKSLAIHKAQLLKEELK